MHYLTKITGRNLSVFRKLKIANYFYTDFRSIRPHDLFDQEFDFFDCVVGSHMIIQPTTYAHLMMFICCYKVGDVSGCIQAMRELSTEANHCRKFRFESKLAVAYLYSCTGVCCEVLGDQVQALLNYVNAVDIYPEYTPVINRYRELLKSINICILPN